MQLEFAYYAASVTQQGVKEREREPAAEPVVHFLSRKLGLIAHKDGWLQVFLILLHWFVMNNKISLD